MSERIDTIATTINELQWGEMIELARTFRDMIQDDEEFDASSIDCYAWKLHSWAEGHLQFLAEEAAA